VLVGCANHHLQGCWEQDVVDESQLLHGKMTCYILGVCPGESWLFKEKKTRDMFKDGL